MTWELREVNEKGIFVEAEKVVLSNGDLGYKIKKLSCLPVEKLPAMYLQSMPRCTFYYGGTDGVPSISIRTETYDFSIKVGEALTKEEFDNVVKILVECGENLKSVNEDLKRRRENWNGIVKVVI